MKVLFYLILLLGVCRMQAQNLSSPTAGPLRDVYVQHNQRSSTSSFDPVLEPFYHGVASGDPLSDRVIIWTRVTSSQPTVSGTWEVATDTAMINTVQSGSFSTDGSKDYTVKVDVTGLSSNTTYYYQFEVSGDKSLIGRTKTAPAGNEENHLRFAVVSCQNYEAGFFNAYGRIADRNDLHGIIHLGDYIYEYPTGYYGDSTLAVNGIRAHDTTETISLAEYRARYSLYRLDQDLRRAHQQHPIIATWDDHESANDAHANGAQNHNPATEGSWAVRKEISRQVYYEWMPIRENNPDTILYRTLNYGNLMDLIMLDTRIVGRDIQINDVTNPALYAPTRTMLGATQRAWFLNELQNSTAKWKVIGNQVIFSDFNVGWASSFTGQTPAQTESQFLDIWDGYPAERQTIIDTIRNQTINNVVFLTGDFHSTFAFDVCDTVTNAAAGYLPVPNYNPATGAGSVAVEFATPSITSANFDENVGTAAATLFESLMNAPLGQQPGDNPNPHMKQVDLDQHGYFLLDVRDDSTQANWYYVDRIDDRSEVESFGGAQYTLDLDNHLNPASAASPQKSQQDIPAPTPANLVATTAAEYFQVLSAFPNPATDYSLLQYALNQSAEVQIDLFDLNGQLVKPLVNAEQAAGVYDLHLVTQDLPAGMYVYRLQINGQLFQQKLVVQ